MIVQMMLVQVVLLKNLGYLCWIKRFGAPNAFKLGWFFRQNLSESPEGYFNLMIAQIDINNIRPDSA